jgi:quinolinate synthase
VNLAAEHDELIIGTELGLVDKLQAEYPEKTFVPLSKAAICGNMKANTVAKLAWSLDNLQFEVTMPEEVRAKAEKALRGMLAVAGSWEGTPEEQEKLEMAGVRSDGCGCG